MRKIYAFFIMMSFCVLTFAQNINGVFYESFNSSQSVGGNDKVFSGITGSTKYTMVNIDKYLDNNGWVVGEDVSTSNVWCGNQCARFGSATKGYGGILTYKGLSLECKKTYTLGYRTAMWKSTNKSTSVAVVVTVSDANGIYEDQFMIPFSDRAKWLDHEFTFSGFGYGTTISITTKSVGATNENRAFVDELYVVEGETAVSIEKPIFTVPLGDYVEKKVGTFVVPENTTVYYTTDGTIPNMNSTKYVLGTEVEISESSNVHAIAIDDNGNFGHISDTNIHIYVPNSIGDFRNLNSEGLVALCLKNAIVIGGGKTTVYLQDDTGSIGVVNSGIGAKSGSSYTWPVGGRVNGYIIGYKKWSSAYNHYFERNKLNLENIIIDVDANAYLTPKSVTISQLRNAYMRKYGEFVDGLVRVSGVAKKKNGEWWLYDEVNKDSILVSNVFYNFEDKLFTEYGGIASVVGVHVVSGNAKSFKMQVRPRMAEDITTYPKTSDEGVVNVDFEYGIAVSQNIAAYGDDMSQYETELYGAQSVMGWENKSEGSDGGNYVGDGVAAGLFAYGTEPMLCGNMLSAPKKGYNGNKALGLLAVEGNKVLYTQEVALTPGNYSLEVPIYNAGGDGEVINLIGVDGKYLSMTSYPAGKWTTETKYFTVTDEKNVMVSVGYQSLGGGADVNPHLFVEEFNLRKLSEAESATVSFENEIAKAQFIHDDAIVGVNVFQYLPASADKYQKAIDKANGQLATLTEELDIYNAIADLRNATKQFVPTQPKATDQFLFLNKATGLYLDLSDGVSLSEEGTPISLHRNDDDNWYIYNTECRRYLGYDVDKGWILTNKKNDCFYIVVESFNNYYIISDFGYVGISGIDEKYSVVGDADYGSSSEWFFEYYVESDVSTPDAENDTSESDATIIERSNINASSVTYYNLNGMQMNSPQKGVNLVKMSDGKFYKVIK